MSKLDLILPLGDPRLYEKSTVIAPGEVAKLMPVVSDLRDILFEFKAKYNAGRGIAAPQIGVMRRLIFIYIDRPMIIINPVLSNLSEDLFELWDDCMCFPNLLVRLKRHRSLTLTYRDEQWKECQMDAQDALSELIQHEFDHLDGILATQRALDDRSFRWKV